LFIWFLIVSAFIAYFTFPFWLDFLERQGYTQRNFRDKLVPVGSGIILTSTLIASLGVTALIFDLNLRASSQVAYSLVIWVLGVAFFGQLDDLLGDRSTRGFTGHFRQIKRGRVTTGVLKALGSGALSLYVAVAFSEIPLLLILNALILVLTVNTFNLLDLRPGRALKVFLLVWLVLFVAARDSQVWSFLGLFLAPAMLLLRVDLEERAMLGDVGSNVLGAVIGFSLVLSLGTVGKLAALTVLVLMQLLTERYSISEAVEKIGPLKRLDEWGRRKG
jgi:UDP-N-acetylmuramyl pentapeptide phosphotransferase/UDP-N-acetylglucosamine-1-phosphate transferase